MQRAGIGMLEMLAEELELAEKWDVVTVQEVLLPGSDEED